MNVPLEVLPAPGRHSLDTGNVPECTCTDDELIAAARQSVCALGAPILELARRYGAQHVVNHLVNAAAAVDDLLDAVSEEVRGG